MGDWHFDADPIDRESSIMDFNKLVGTEQSFYGVDGVNFKLGRYVFKAVEDESDGYRSYLGEIAPVKGGGFSNRALAKVSVVEVKDGGSPAKRTASDGPSNIDSGYRLVDADGHIWLEIGTDNEDDYYPCFIFNYTPKS